MKLYTKHFDHKGQMINYFNKVKDNPQIASVWCYFGVGEGYTLHYIYKENKKA